MMHVATREHVLWAYRLFLGREPESEDAVSNHLVSGRTVAEVRNTFLRSAEFERKSVNLVLSVADGTSHQDGIEHVESAAALSSLISHVARQWSRLGEAEPHWSVLTSEEFLSSNVEKNLQFFYESGVRELEAMDLVLARNKLAWPSDGTCLELGCGVGRVTLALAQRCKTIFGVDVSDSHLRLAAERAQQTAVADRINWVHLNEIGGLVKLPKVDMVYSRIVLQHNPPPVIERLLSAMLGRLKAGGVGVFQLPTFMPGYSFRLDEYLQSVRSGRRQGMEMHMLPQSRIFQLIHEAGCVCSEVFLDNAAGDIYVSQTFVVKALC